MDRRAYLAAVGAAGLGATAGCTRVRNEVESRRAGADFEFPPAWGPNGVTDSEAAFFRHADALRGRTYTATLTVPGSPTETGAVREGGLSGGQRWVVDRPGVLFDDVYVGDSIEYAGRRTGSDRPSYLAVGDWDGRRTIRSWLGDAVGVEFEAALNLPYGAGSLAVDDDADPPVATFLVEETPRDDRVEAVDVLRLSVDGDGVVRNLEARYTPASTNAYDPDEQRYAYDLSLDERPPDDVAGRPTELADYPTFGADWRADGRVLELTNTGGGPVHGGPSRLFATNVGDSAAGTAVNVEDVAPLAPGETVYCTLEDRQLRASAAPPDDPKSYDAVRPDEPVRFGYHQDDLDGEPLELYHSTACDGLDC